MGQLSFWSADARPRALGDLEGLLCGPGRAELFGSGRAARLVIVLGPPPAPEPEPDEDADAGPDEDDEADEIEEAVPEPETDEAPPDDAPPDDAPPDDAPALGPDDFAFLDLDPEEIAARLGVRPERSTPRVLEPRAGGFPDVERQRGRQAEKHADPEDDPVTRWRVRAVCCALRARGVPAEAGRASDGRPEVRTAFRTDLVDLARGWTGGGGMKLAPAEFELDGPRLRLWVLAAGGLAGRAYTLGLDPEVRTLDDRLLTASRHLGLGASLSGDARLPALRIVGARRQRRLTELVGRPPRDLADGVWPV